MRHIVLLVPAARRLAVQKIIDLAFGNHDPVVHLAFTHAGNGHLTANFFTKIGEGDTVPLQRFAELLHRHIVIGGDPLQGLFQHRIIDMQTDFPRVLQLQFIDDHAFEHLPLQLVARRQRSSLLSQLPQCQFQSVSQLDLGNDFVVDDGDDMVGRLQVRIRRCGSLRKQSP